MPTDPQPIPDAPEKDMGTRSRVAPSSIRNKLKREEVFHKIKGEKRRAKLKTRMRQKEEESRNPELKEERLKKNVPRTLENTREFDETLVEEDEEVLKEEDIDEFASYFNEGVAPNVLVTTSRRPTADVYEFANELCDVFPSCKFIKRGSTLEVKKLVQLAVKRDFTDLIIINEDKKIPNALTFIHLPNGPTARFKLTSMRHSKDIANHGRSTPHLPELILNNFSTRLGHTIGRMFASLFPHQPEFKGRQVCTLHNQRDFIFFRRHRYIFKEGKRADLQELGPRFTLKLQWLQKGTFDTKFGEYEWMHRPEMDTSRKRFFL